MPEPYERKNLEKRLPGPAKVGRGGSGSMGGAKAYHFGKALLYYCKSQCLLFAALFSWRWPVPC